MNCTPSIESFYGVWQNWKLLRELYHGKHQATTIIRKVVILACNKTWVESIVLWLIFWFTSATTCFNQKLVRRSKLGKEEYVADLYSLENIYYSKKQVRASNLSSKKKHFSCARTVTWDKDIWSGSKSGEMFGFVHLVFLMPFPASPVARDWLKSPCTNWEDTEALAQLPAWWQKML